MIQDFGQHDSGFLGQQAESDMRAACIANVAWIRSRSLLFNLEQLSSRWRGMSPGCQHESDTGPEHDFVQKKLDAFLLGGRVFMTISLGIGGRGISRCKK